MLNKLKNNLLIKNTLILIISSFIIKLLSLINRIIITRLLGNDGISLYVLILPTIMLLCSISGFSLNITIAKTTAENEKKLEFSRKNILRSGITIGLYTTIITSIIFILSIKFISVNLLKAKQSYYPLLASLTMIPLSMLNGVYRGFLNGLDDIKTSSNSSLIEQISRMITSSILLIVFINKGVVISVTISIFSMTIGELFSLFYNLIKIKKINLNNIYNNNMPIKIISKISFQETLTHLIVNISFFLEPIIYTYALNKININSNEIMYHYSEVNAYAIPLLTMFVFTSSCIQTVILPTLSKNNFNQKSETLIKKSLEIALIPGILLGIILFYYGDKYLFLLYKSTSGSFFVKTYSLLFIFSYLNPIFLGALQSHNKQKRILYISIFCSILKLLLILIFTNIKLINYKSLFLSYVVTNILHTFLYYIEVKKIVNLKISLHKIIKTICFFTINFYLCYLINLLNMHFIINTLIFTLVYLILTKIIIIDSLKN